MAEIPTVSGIIAPEDLGIVSLNEHLFFGLPGWQFDPEVVFDSAAAFEGLCTTLENFKNLGGKTIVDTSGITLGRNVPLYSKIAKATGVNIVGTTGFHDQHTSMPGHFIGLYANFYNVKGPYYWHREVPGNFYPSHGGTKDYLLYLFYNELTKGMVAPGMIRTKSEAAMITSGSGWDDISNAEETSIRGAALAAKRTGTAVIVNPVNQVQKQIAIMVEEGLTADRIIVGHCDDGRAIDLERDRKFAEQGHYIAYDHIGWEDAADSSGIPDERRVELVTEMVKAGFTERIILSCNAICYGLGVPQSKHSISYLLQNFVPWLQKAGIGDSTIHTILVENTRRILTRI